MRCTTRRMANLERAVRLTSAGARLMMRLGGCEMRTNGSDRFGFVAFPSADAAGAAALEFLERSRDVADEVAVDGTRGETSTSGREKDIAPRSGPAV